jgi:hypothetical protein
VMEGQETRDHSPPSSGLYLTSRGSCCQRLSQREGHQAIAVVEEASKRSGVWSQKKTSSPIRSEDNLYGIFLLVNIPILRQSSFCRERERERERQKSIEEREIETERGKGQIREGEER